MTDTQTSWLLGRSQAILDQLPYRSDLTIADMGALGLVELFDKATYLYKGSLLTPDVDGHTMAMFFQSWARVATALQAADTVVAPERNPDARLDVSVPSRDYNDHRVQPGWKLPKREQTPGYRYREPHIARVSLWDVGDGSILVSRDFTSLSNYRDRLAGTAKTTKLPRAAHISGAVKLPAESSEIAHAEAEWTWTGALKHWFAVRARSKRPAHTARIADRAVRAETVLPASQTRELGEATVATAMPTAESLDRLTSYAEERATLDEATGAYASAVREMSSWLADRRPIDVPSADGGVLRAVYGVVGHGSVDAGALTRNGIVLRIPAAGSTLAPRDAELVGLVLREYPVVVRTLHAAALTTVETLSRALNNARAADLQG